MTGEPPGSSGLIDPSRLVGFSDGVFTVAVTLLVLTLNVPAHLDSTQFREAFKDLMPSVGAYALSFAVISGFWLAHHRLFERVRQIDGRFLVLNLLFLGVVTIIPFPTELLGNYGDEPLAVMAYAAAIGTASLLSTVLWWYASHDERFIEGPAPLGKGSRYSTSRGTVVAVVFLGSIPIAAFDTALAKYFWLSAIVARLVVVGRAKRAAASRSQ